MPSTSPKQFTLAGRLLIACCVLTLQLVKKLPYAHSDNKSSPQLSHAGQDGWTRRLIEAISLAVGWLFFEDYGQEIAKAAALRN